MKNTPRLDRFINLMEFTFHITDTVLMERLHALLKAGKVEFGEFLKPYVEAALRDADLITRAVIVADRLLVRLGYRNGDLTEGYTVEDLKFILADFEHIVAGLKEEISVLEGREG